jgi:methylmalonyl-CoA decarboxylase subunit alpha
MFGPSPAGSAYVPALCDLTVMVEGAATAYLGSPRMSEMATGEKVTLEDMGGARMHCEVSGLGDALVASEHEALGLLRDWLAFFPSSWRQDPERTDARPPAEGPPMHMKRDALQPDHGDLRRARAPSLHRRRAGQVRG